MARTRGVSGAAYAVSLVIFVIFFIFSLGFAILFYTQSTAADQKARKATEALNHLATAPERAAIESEFPNRTGTAVSVLHDENQRLKQRLVGSPTVSMDSIQQQLKAGGIDPSQSMLYLVRSLQATKTADDEAIDSLKKEVAAARDARKAMENEKAALAASYDDAIAKANAQLTQIQDENKQYRDSEAGNYKKLEDQFTAVRDQSAKAADVQQTALREKDHEIDQLNQRIRTLEARITPVEKGTIHPETQVDGHIAAVVYEQGLVYIDRGRKDRITAGLTFEVFDKLTGVSTNEVGDVRGKATIEVINIGENSSVCRIVRQERGKTVNEGDLIVNAVYDPNVRFKFVVFGEFDVDNTGQASISDRRRIETMITQWGGILSDELSFDTDFLILGQEPKPPEPLKQGDLDPTHIQVHEEEARRYKQYQDLKANAKALAVPILNQNRFLALVGHYQR